MFDFNKVFLSVKELSSNKKQLKATNSFDHIVHEIGIRQDKLDLYLSVMHDLDLVTYKPVEKTVAITSFGAGHSIIQVN